MKILIPFILVISWGCAGFQDDICDTLCLIQATSSAACDAYSGNYLGIITGAADTTECLQMCMENRPVYESFDPECLTEIYNNMGGGDWTCPTIETCK